RWARFGASRLAPTMVAIAAGMIMFFSFVCPTSWASWSGEDRWRIWLADGSFQAKWLGPPMLGEVPIIEDSFLPGGPPPPYRTWWFALQWQGGRGGIAVPLWAPFLVLGAWAWRAQRRF